MAKALMRGAVAALDEGTWTFALAATINDVLVLTRKPNVPPDADAWTLPDAVWEAACAKNRGLRLYPLGECCERAVKRTLATLILAKKEIPQAVGNAASELSRARPEDQQLFDRILGEVVFEICMDRLRRRSQWAYGYHFGRGGRAVTLASTNRLRGDLLRQCMALASSLRSEVAVVRDGHVRCDGGRLPGALERVVGVHPKQRWVSPQSNWVNILAGPVARQPELAMNSGHCHPPKDRPLRVLLHDPSPYAVSFSFDDFEEGVGTLPPLVRDLLDLAVTISVSDLYTARDSELVRRNSLQLSVRCPDAWTSASKHVQRLVAYLGREDLSVSFVQRKAAQGKQSFQVDCDGRCVCLFSGGLDSLAGAVWALEKGLEPILVSHRRGGDLAACQSKLAGEVGRIFERTLLHVSFHAAKHKRSHYPAARKSVFDLGPRQRSVMNQHLRSFLFLAAGAAVALVRGIKLVYLFENGPVALNPSISEAGVNTLTAHPHVVAEFRRLVKAVFGADLWIENPFIYLTKGEVIRMHLSQGELQSLIAGSLSCWSWSKVALMAMQAGFGTTTATHDGTCLPCIVRRCALEVAGLRSCDAGYVVDVFGGYPNLPLETTTSVADLLRFCRAVRAARHPGELLKLVPELSVYGAGVKCESLGRMLRRHAVEVRTAFQMLGNQALRNDFKALLDPLAPRES
ncbi:MAG: 7-cyano-7-deazaguanine synthase [Acidobacteriota bacterium]